MLLTVGNTKGGVGKSTHAMNIAIVRFIAGQDMLRVDSDDQSIARDFTELRRQLVGNVGYATVAL